jgi:hypothetical protein
VDLPGMKRPTPMGQLNLRPAWGDRCFVPESLLLVVEER